MHSTLVPKTHCVHHTKKVSAIYYMWKWWCNWTICQSSRSPIFLIYSIFNGQRKLKYSEHWKYFYSLYILYYILCFWIQLICRWQQWIAVYIYIYAIIQCRKPMQHIDFIRKWSSITWNLRRFITLCTLENWILYLNHKTYRYVLVIFPWPHART